MATKWKTAIEKAEAAINAAETSEELMQIVVGMKPADAENLTGLIISRQEVLAKDEARKQMTGED